MKHKPPRDFMEEFNGYWYIPPDDLMRAIGRVAVRAAAIEDLLHVIYWRYADAAFDVAPIVTRDMRPGRLAEDIIAMAVIFDEDEKIIRDLKDLFADYRAATEKRNQIIHWIRHQPKSKRWRKYPLVPPVYKHKKDPTTFRIKDIDKLADDLSWIEARMYSHSLSADDFEEQRKQFGPFARYIVPAPWLGKRYPPIPKQWRRPAKRKRRKRQPRSYRA